MKTTQRLWLYVIQQNSKKLNRLPGKYQTVGRILTSSRRYLSTLQQPVYETSVASDGIVKSPYPDITIPNLTIDQFVWQNFDKWADFEALECQVTGRKYTFSQLRTLSRRFASSLRKQGFKPGDVLAVMLPNMPDYAVIILGAMEAGLIVSTINPIYTPYELSHQLHDNKAVALLTLPEQLEKLEKAKKLIQAKTNSPYNLDLITLNYNSSSVAVPSGTVDYNDMISDNVEILDIKPSRTLNDVALLPYSSGTTGLSKGVQLSHRNVIANFLQVNHPEIGHIRMATKDYQDVIPGILPFFHIYGLSVILLRGLSNGCKIVSLPKFETTGFLSILKDKKASVLYAVPPIVLLLGQNPLVTQDHFAHLRFMINGAGPVSADDAERVIARTKNNFTFNQAYGLTETSPVVFVSPATKQDYSSLGVPIRSTTAKIVKSDGTLGGLRENGEICIKGPQIMKGYHNKPDATTEVIDDEGYFHTGDVGYYDEEGRFYIVERIKELIKVQGFQVPPAELEAILRNHPSVIDSAVVGVPDDRTGEKPLAFVVLKKGKTASESDLKDFVAERVAPFKKLGGVRFVDSIPKNPSGKILRRILKEKYVS
ncbi:uncharacterized protein LOC135835097 [Planococcus citri]|uniref:uncharacterized protein LOC135835097 n=1 Tax=Planococcus citri TaxID=170843 RepID=UPI0031F8ED9D